MPKVIEENPHFLTDACFIAIDTENGNFAGISMLSKPSLVDYLDTGLTGVLREYHGRDLERTGQQRDAGDQQKNGLCPATGVDLF
jgi:hypothetical protein